MEIDNQVMSADNGHNPFLVSLINEYHYKFGYDFLLILQLIMHKKANDVYKKYPHLKIDNIGDIYDYKTELLTHLCNDKDLECIIAYCRL